MFTNKANGFKYWDVKDVYSPCEYSARADFWEDSEEVRHWWDGPICFPGDSNVVRSDDGWNKGEVDSMNSSFLNNFILQQEMVDQSFVGGSYTWSNNHVDPFLCRLDKFLFSVDFDEAFPNALQIELTRTVSEHNPLMNLKHIVKPWGFTEFGAVSNEKSCSLNRLVN
ncbi:uncharacterized protein LOC113274478 [Papaver somniferum]|uniref:uncharacterized protein LOC113274478 n=1 Tax=Papaver somniferum TaxID=3469 RepID=UPI000E6FC627|nr:uncharacterized protein LOC113274478 [Papaver somniferum]